MIVSPRQTLPQTQVACQTRHGESGGHNLFRYIRYNGLNRPDVKRDDETPATVADIEQRIPRPLMTLGALDPATSLTIGQDETVEVAGVTSSMLETCTRTADRKRMTPERPNWPLKSHLGGGGGLVRES
jgi:hypothetical protein